MKIIVVTPAGRRAYLELLKHYVLRDEAVSEWHLWDNCRDPLDRAYISALAESSPRIRLVSVAGADGTNSAVNRFYKHCDDADAFYIKMDDDIVFIEQGMAGSLLQAALRDRTRYLWWSPLVINNAICSYVIKHSDASLPMPFGLTAQAACPQGWRNPEVAVHLHRGFLAALRQGCLPRVADHDVSLSRFSINCLGFFGADAIALGNTFCPLGVDDEEWLSATLPVKLGRPGRLVGGVCVSHFSFFTQEAALLATDVLDCYYREAGLDRTFPLPVRRGPPRWRRLLRPAAALFRWVRRQVLQRAA